MPAAFALSFTRPEGLLLLLVLLPFVVYLSRTSLAVLRRGRRRISLALRLLMVALVVLAFSGLEVVAASQKLAVVFLLDRSDSISIQGREVESVLVRQAVNTMGPDDSVGVVAFGAEPVVDRPVSHDSTPPDLASKPPSTFTNVADAIRLGMAVAPGDTERRLVLVSDGRENSGSAEWAARLAAANDVPIDVVTLEAPTGPEVWLDGVQTPNTLHENERASLSITVKSSTDTSATLQVYVDGQPGPSQVVRLPAGTSNFVQALPPATRGFHTFTAQVIPTEGSDTGRENNRFSAYSIVQGRPRVLLVEGKPGEGEALRRALSPSTDVDLVPPSSMPAEVPALAGYEGVILVNVPATSLSNAGMSALQTSVRDLGKGLVVVGGDESYAAGGYFRTPLEEMLPVDLNLPSKLDIPTVAMALVIDRSGSMGEGHSSGGGSVTKLELAKEAAYRAVAQLSANDYVGVVAFDSGANWIVDLQQLGEPLRFKDRIKGISLGGGTNIYSGLSPAVDALVASKAKSKHIVLLTDGQSEGGDYDELLRKMGASNITLSTVGIGQDADQAFLQAMAQRGKGRYYYTEEGDALPEIFAHESHLASRSYLIEHRFSPSRTSPSPILDGLGGLPDLLGYIGTSQKPGGQIVMVSDAGDPLLAQWQYGLGRVVAWTSDAKGQWGTSWVGWEGFPQFWSQAVRWSTGAQGSTLLQPRVETEGSTAHVTLDASAPDGAYLNALQPQVTIVAPDLTTSTLSLPQTAAGRYEGTFPATQEGAYLMRVEATQGQARGATQTFGMIVPYSPEYRGDEGDSSLLQRVASLTRGRVLAPGDGQALFTRTPSPVRTATPLWPFLLLLAILLLPLDIGVRRVAVYRSDVHRAIRALSARLTARASPAPAAAGATGHVAALAAAKRRAIESAPHEISGPRSLPPPPAASSTPAESGPARDLQLIDHVGRSAPPYAGGTEGAELQNAPAEMEESLATRLRRAREQRG